MSSSRLSLRALRPTADGDSVIRSTCPSFGAESSGEHPAAFPSSQPLRGLENLADSGPTSTDADELSSDNEVYGLDLPDDASDDEDDAEEEVEELDDEEEEEYPSEDEPAREEPRGRFAKTANPAQDLPSDASAASDDEEEAEENSEDEEETWAPGSYHASRRAPGEADSSDDEALELEAEEARRLQRKARDTLGGEDYGVGEEESDGETEKQRKKARGKGRLEDSEEQAAGGKKVEEKQWTEEEAIAHLLKKSPETLALLDDFTATAERIKGVEKNLEIVRRGDEDGKEHPALAIMELEHRESQFSLSLASALISLSRSQRPSQPTFLLSPSTSPSSSPHHLPPTSSPKSSPASLPFVKLSPRWRNSTSPLLNTRTATRTERRRMSVMRRREMA